MQGTHGSLKSETLSRISHMHYQNIFLLFYPALVKMKITNSVLLSSLGDCQFYWILKINAQVKNIILSAVFVYAYMCEYGLKPGRVL